MKRSYTVAFEIKCIDTTASTHGNLLKAWEACAYGQIAFPEWDAFKGRQFPVFNVTEEMTIDPELFVDYVSYITLSHQRIWLWSFILTIIAFSCLLLAGCFQLVYWANTPVKKELSARLKRFENFQN